MPDNRYEEEVSNRDLIVIGASAGGIEALKIIVSGLLPDIPASILIVNHVFAGHRSVLPNILRYQGLLPSSHPKDGETIRQGHIYVAPPDCHMMIERGTICLTRGPKENYSRPSINPLFRSAAREYGPRVVGVILSGMLDDGTAGLIDVKMHGGMTIVQDPNDALYPEMPRNASRYIEVDYRVQASEIASLLDRLCREPLMKGEIVTPDNTENDSEKIQQDIEQRERGLKAEGPAIFVCPDCGGPMWEFQTDEFRQFQCRVGHKYSPETLLVSHAEVLERALWRALRTLEERISLLREMGDIASRNGDQEKASQLRQEEKEVIAKAKTIREMLASSDEQT